MNYIHFIKLCLALGALSRKKRRLLKMNQRNMLILNVVLILFIPLGVVLLSGYLASTFLQTVGIIIVSILGLVVILTTSYLMGLFNIFTTAVWVLTYSVLTEKGYHEKIKDSDIGGGELKEGEGEKIKERNSDQ